MKEKERLVKVVITGFVLGNLWGSGSRGGTGAYPARMIVGDDEKNAVAMAESMLKDGSLDSGMGFEYLHGARLYVERRFVLDIDGKSYHREETETVTIGVMTDAQRDFLLGVAEQ